MSEAAIEAEVVAKGKTAPRITPQDIDDLILHESYGRCSALDFDHAGIRSQQHLSTAIDALGCLTICVLVLKNGFTLVGKSACASPANFDAEIGRKLAREDARRQIWALEGYRLRSKLAGG